MKKSNDAFPKIMNIRSGKHSLNLGERTHLMGILNVTPDSFSDGGRFEELQSALQHAQEMVDQGADIIDIGGESTRPGHTPVTVDEEMHRVLPVVECLVRELDVMISVDTSKADVADKVLEAGAHMVNDVWGLQKDPDMASVISMHDVPIVIMHNQAGTDYVGDIMFAIKQFLKDSIRIAADAGIRNENIILDPGIGFGKTAEQNIQVMNRLNELQDLGYPILMGASRKSMIGHILDVEKNERLEGTLSTSVIGVMKGVDIVRVHDVRENYRAIKVADAIMRGEQNG